VNPVEQALAEFVTSVHYQDLPTYAQRQLIRALGDLVGVSIAGLGTESANIVLRLAGRLFPGNEATVVGRGRTCSAAGAAMANAAAASALDLDDGYRPAKGHPGAIVVPAALASAEKNGSSGADFLAAIAAGYETGLRTAVAWHTSRETYHGSGSWGSVGAAAACARLAELSPEQTLQALAIAEFHAPLAPTMASVDHPSTAKNAVYWGAVVGLTAVELAAEGFTAPPSTLASVVSSVDTLGTDWWLERIYYKFMPCCRWAQPAVAGVVALRENHGIDPESIQRVSIRTFSAAARLNVTSPKTTVDAQYSLPFPAACALLHGNLSVAHITGNGLTDPKALELASRVDMSTDSELESRFPEEALARVTVILKDGRELTIGPIAASGDADTPPTDAELRSKFMELSQPVLASDKAEALHQRILGCPELTDIRRLTELLGDLHQ